MTGRIAFGLLVTAAVLITGSVLLGARLYAWEELMWVWIAVTFAWIARIQS